MIPRRPIVDTGPLFDFLWLRYCEAIHRPILSGEFLYLRDGFSREATRWYFSIARPLLTCPQVMMEVHYHARKLTKNRIGDFWKVAQRELTGLGLDENLVKLIQMDSQTLCSFGPADTALIHMACKQGEMSSSILTEDGKLSGHCRQKRIHALSVGEVIGLWQRFGSMGAV